VQNTEHTGSLGINVVRLRCQLADGGEEVALQFDQQPHRGREQQLDFGPFVF
jgi:hypothetical protein